MTKRKPPVETGDEVIVKIEDYASEGEGIARINGFTIFIQGALVGEEVKISIETVKKTYARGGLLDKGILTPSPSRIEPSCPFYPDCGGCQLLHQTYKEQLLMKQQRLTDVLSRIGGITDAIIHQIIGMDNPWHYRNKAQYPFGEKDDRIIAGCYRKRTHQVINTPDCKIQHPKNNEIIEGVRKLAGKLGLPVYDEKTHKGFLRHVLVRRAYKTGEISVALVTNGSYFPEGEKFAKELAEKFTDIKSIVQNINPTRGNKILGDKTIILWGKEGIIDTIGDLEFQISPTSFYQVNPVQMLILYKKAIEFANLSGHENVLDIYCGVGTLTLFLAKNAKEVYGIESNKHSIESAIKNTNRNGIKNAHFIAGFAEKVLPALTRTGRIFDVAVLDPPRAGCQLEVLKTLASLKINRIIYVSCNPGTLARDLKILTQLGYKAKDVQPVDMFPQTCHVECVTLMSRVEK